MPSIDRRLPADGRTVSSRAESLAQAMAERSRFPFGLPRLLRWAENQKSFPKSCTWPA